MKKRLAVVGAGMVVVALMGTYVARTPTVAVADPKPSPMFSSMPAARELKIMACCDSITVGIGGAGYRDDLTDLLEREGTEVTWVVTASPGTTCALWSPLIESLVKANRPDVLLLNCGTNDGVATSSQIKAFETNYARMINATRDAGIKLAVAKIQISNIDNMPEKAWLPPSEKRVNTSIGKLAGMYGDVALVDLSVIPATAENNPDGVHPGPVGEKLYADAWFEQGRLLGWW